MKIWTSLWFAVITFTSLSVSLAAEQVVSRDALMAVFGELKKDENINPEKAVLGERLFHDPRLSVNNAVSCASCHVLSEGGDDGVALSVGVSGEKTSRNSPSIFNLDTHIAYFWDGRAASLSEQIDGPIHHPDEMGETWPSIVKKLSADTNLRPIFFDLYGGINADAIKDAIVEFERSLVTNDSAFDLFMAGDDAALSEEALKGASHFVNFGCASCHQAASVGGNLYQYFGIYDPQRKDSPREKLKVPSLRNVAHTAPYFNDGREPTLGGAIRTMGAMQLGRRLADEDVAEIEAFLRSLSSPRFGEAKTNDDH